MTQYALDLPDSLLAAARKVAQQDGATVRRWISSSPSHWRRSSPQSRRWIISDSAPAAQIQTYARLQGLLTTKPSIGGVLVYLNELVPTRSDLFDLRRALRDGTPGVLASDAGSDDADLLMN